MAEMFVSPQRPFYQSTELMNLSPLNEQVYYDFANRFFTARGWGLDCAVFHELYSAFDGYTWYIQTVLNRMYQAFRTVSNTAQLNETILAAVESKAPQYESLVQFLTDNQFSLLRAIAKEGLVEKPLGKDFIKKYHLSGASSVKTSLDMLLDKELAYRQTNGHTVYDRFLAQWLRRL